ncbi:hypothetical protein BKA70DRAFT_1423939 [Coprinopsis sp. MPI-PUGE-AT-0042]|nr:hypothetical protein BKA70DRAFT_1423939 [Coprinopsis sp. MPI-PUGE-AT-0042]
MSPRTPLKLQIQSIEDWAALSLLRRADAIFRPDAMRFRRGFVSLQVRAVTEAGGHVLSSLFTSIKALRLKFGDGPQGPPPGPPAQVQAPVPPRSAPPYTPLYLLPRVHAEQLMMEEERSRKGLLNRLSPYRLIRFLVPRLLRLYQTLCAFFYRKRDAVGGSGCQNPRFHIGPRRESLYGEPLDEAINQEIANLYAELETLYTEVDALINRIDKARSSLRASV